MEELCMTLHIEYDNDKAVIKPPYYSEVEKVANFMKRFPEQKGTIEGHTDSNASDKYNMKLSRERAEAVADYLAKNFKLDSGRVVPIWYGEANPVASNDTPEGRAKNRRVEVSSPACNSTFITNKTKGWLNEPKAPVFKNRHIVLTDVLLLVFYTVQGGVSSPSGPQDIRAGDDYYIRY
jgi:hypothetical protein